MASSMLEASTLLVANLSQMASNGASLWGTLDAPRLPQYLETASGALPWNPFGPRDPFAPQAPFTGVTRHYDWTISRREIAPDGVQKSAILINGQFPGPLVEANWGDQVEVIVRNELSYPEEGTTIHWHGLLQQNTPWMDGVPGVSQCPLAPGKEFTYRFTADQYGTSWYHGHYSSQLSGGLIGPLVIYGPQHIDYDIDIGPVILTDWTHLNNYEVIADDLSIPPRQPNVDDNLINGKMNFNCSLTNSTCTANAGVSKFAFESGKTHRLRLINAGSEGLQRFTIDDHTMTVIAVDFVPIIPYETTMVTLAAGQRTDILVRGTGLPSGAYWMRSNFSQACSSSHSLQPNAVAAIYYPDAKKNIRPSSTATPYTETSCLNDPLEKTIPFVSLTPPRSPAATETWELNLAQNSSGNIVFSLDGVSFRANYNTPILPIANQGSRACGGSSRYTEEQNVHDFGRNISIRLIVTNPLALSHPMHLHGHNFWILAQGMGTWNGTIPNPINPTRRDTFIIDAGTPELPAYTVIEWAADNPGVWAFHCHISSHVSLGLNANIVERPDLIERMKIPSAVNQLCKDWDAFTRHNIVDEIDSGV